ncbi:deoxyhypusine synthase, partial [Candidatus Bathyarchaeota archaeon]
MLKEYIKDYEFREGITINELINQMEDAWGFTAGKLSSSINILERMIKDKNCKKFLSFTANL